MSKKILQLSRKLLRKDPVLVIRGHDFNRDPHRSGETHSRDVSAFQGNCVEDWANHKINKGWWVESREKRAFIVLFGTKFNGFQRFV
ncbi:hypothetical protein CEXT_495661 [Caerostris extrusa]|uniref:Uncharacterized protein n=1 Tax=Caerostris extrusa TaxID=172846 RepID=A0AAV4TPX5_CAEEX|nr:hypothetical protein CEXT_495661 [Caerostris extrusa]